MVCYLASCGEVCVSGLGDRILYKPGVPNSLDVSSYEIRRAVSFNKDATHNNAALSYNISMSYILQWQNRIINPWKNSSAKLWDCLWARYLIGI